MRSLKFHRRCHFSRHAHTTSQHCSNTALRDSKDLWDFIKCSPSHLVLYGDEYRLQWVHLADLLISLRTWLGEFMRFTAPDSGSSSSAFCSHLILRQTPTYTSRSIVIDCDRCEMPACHVRGRGQGRNLKLLKRYRKYAGDLKHQANEFACSLKLFLILSL